MFGYASYYLKSKTKHSVHSPFVFDLITQVFEKKEDSPQIHEVMSIYREMVRSSRVLETTDFGAFSESGSYVTRFLTVSQIAKGSSVSRKKGALLFNLVSHFKPANVLELGTSLGISTLYISKAIPESRIITMEGCAAKVEVAKANFVKSEVSNVEVSTGRFDTQLPLVLEKMPQLDFVFLDGHHHYKPTLRYFKQILSHSHEGTVILLDDIHWSAGMKKAWSEIKTHPDVVVTVELYNLGLVFLRKSLSRQHFVIRY